MEYHSRRRLGNVDYCRQRKRSKRVQEEANSVESEGEENSGEVESSGSPDQENEDSAKIVYGGKLLKVSFLKPH